MVMYLWNQLSSIDAIASFQESDGSNQNIYSAVNTQNLLKYQFLFKK